MLWCWLWNMLHCYDRRQAERLIFHFSFPTETSGVIGKTPQYHKFPLLGEIMALVSMNTTQEFVVTIKPVDRKGNPAPVQNANWLTDNSDVLALEPSSDGLSCKVTAVGIAGTANFQVTADADMGSGVTLIQATGDVEVTQAPATTVTFDVGPVTDQP